MAEKRKPISQKLRFEVCQYCGAKAPDVLLEVDHIHLAKQARSWEDFCADVNRLLAERPKSEAR